MAATKMLATISEGEKKNFGALLSAGAPKQAAAALPKLPCPHCHSAPPDPSPARIYRTADTSMHMSIRMSMHMSIRKSIRTLPDMSTHMSVRSLPGMPIHMCTHMSIRTHRPTQSAPPDPRPTVHRPGPALTDRPADMSILMSARMPVHTSMRMPTRISDRHVSPHVLLRRCHGGLAA